MMTLGSAISIARGILNDPNGVRYSDADLLRYANDALDQMVVLAPRLFYTDGEVLCVAGETLQTVGYGDAHALVAVRRVKNGNAVTPADRASLDAFDPAWHRATAAAAVHWLAVENDPVRFLVYPPAPVGQVLEVQYVHVPPEYTATADTTLPATYEDAVSDYIVSRAEARDDEHVNSQRVQQFSNSFVAKVKGV